METRKLRPVKEPLEEGFKSEEMIEKIRINIGEWTFHIERREQIKSYYISGENEKYFNGRIAFNEKLSDINKAKDFINYFLLSYKQVKCYNIDKEIKNFNL